MDVQKKHFKRVMVDFFYEIVPSSRNEILNPNVDYASESFTDGSSPLYKHKVVEHVKKVINGEKVNYHTHELHG